ncbi:hypothetical protein CAPTEDRAFT_178545 [Capitella teleta]|uniref:Amidohydrolase-related domain-containing protein n=1 Tax=Capitella teleta TaxID=283909 RepID=R7UEV3_CAPTE|nr:hypothetical protein CAPTEDRAFT_178545 [Capitella teleta]|eukprot:ELU04611.1 hypothetical protein CAPTEDRAFT_178545 [Capitella teleta]
MFMHYNSRFIKKVQDLDSTLVSPIITPRFAPACDMELMQGLANLSRSYDLPIQSHISENKSEINWIKELYPQSLHYSDVYDRCGLFTNKTVMAHGIYLCDEELDLIVDRGVGIAHCPNSNTSLRSGLCDVRRLLDHGIKVGLGTDVSGGFSPSMLNAIRMSTQVSNTISMQKNKYEHLDYREAFRLATLGGSKVMGLDKEIGNFEKGKQFDALRINPYVIDSPYDLFKRDEIEDSIQKFFYLGDDRNITNVYVAGREVHARNHI